MAGAESSPYFRPPAGVCAAVSVRNLPTRKWLTLPVNITPLLTSLVLFRLYNPKIGQVRLAKGGGMSCRHRRTPTRLSLCTSKSGITDSRGGGGTDKGARGLSAEPLPGTTM